MARSIERTVLLAGMVSAACLATLAQTATAQPYPNQPLRFVVPNPAGGLPDTITRIVGERLRVRIGQGVVVENRPGANAGIGAAAVAQSKPDGYTFLVSDSAIISISPLIYTQLPFNPKDLMPVSLIARAPIFLAATTQLPAKDLKELIAYVKANPGKLNYGSSGVGSFHHLSMEAMKSELGLQINHIPYKGSGESVTALRGGHIDLVFSSYAGLVSAIKGDQARLIAVNSLKRSQQAPEVPVIADVIPGFDLAVLQSVFARTGTPREIVDRIATEMAEIVKEPEVIQKFLAAGIEPDGAGADELAKALKLEGDRVAKVVAATGMAPKKE